MSAKRRLGNAAPPKSAGSTFVNLVRFIQGVHEELTARASRAVNLSLTLRNWLIGWHIAEYELHGADRAKYGEQLLATLSVELEGIGVSSCGRRQLYQYLHFYQVYPQIVRSVTAQFPALIPSPRLREKVRLATAQFGAEPQNMLRRLSYTHFEQLVALDDSSARAFYERECIQGTWSVRELKRQSFEARQKRILIGDTYGFVDLVFYHRLLKCHVLVDLKLEAFGHENIGQLNTYVTWYRKHVMVEGDNPPVGILLCAQKDHALAEYVLGGMDNRLFVSKYQLHLPKPEQLQRELERTLEEEQP